MSFPNIPDVTPTINLERNQVVNLLLASIGFEELGLAHIINAEGEKIQYVLSQNPSLGQLAAINQTVEQTLRTIINKEMLLQFKLENVLEIPENLTPLGPECCISICRRHFFSGGAPPDLTGTLQIEGSVGGTRPPALVLVEILKASSQVLHSQTVPVTGGSYTVNFVIPSSVNRRVTSVRVSGVGAHCTITKSIQEIPDTP